MRIFERKREERNRRIREEIDRGEIISLLRDLKSGNERLILLLEGVALKPDTAAKATEQDPKVKEQLENTKKMIDEWKNGGEGDRWENL